MKKEALLEIIQAVSESAQEKFCEETKKAIAEVAEDEYGTLPFIVRMLSRRPDACISWMMKSRALYQGKEILDPKVCELIALSSAVANRCEFCMDVHMEKALSLGATMEEIFHTILISCAICESSARAVAFRQFRKLEGKHRHEKGAKET